MRWWWRRRRRWLWRVGRQRWWNITGREARRWRWRRPWRWRRWGRWWEGRPDGAIARQRPIWRHDVGHSAQNLVHTVLDDVPKRPAGRIARPRRRTGAHGGDQLVSHHVMHALQLHLHHRLSVREVRVEPLGRVESVDQVLRTLKRGVDAIRIRGSDCRNTRARGIEKVDVRQRHCRARSIANRGEHELPHVAAWRWRWAEWRHLSWREARRWARRGAWGRTQWRWWRVD
mmetsp:Transcript_28207/g.64895  ORF Transcript_28207/g.64895 Transcript_28207/m.64895 type:complete len:230 (+) Transcript_28207:179-868(+)